MTNLYSITDYNRASGQPGNDPKKEPGRSPFRKDYARLLHAAAFRRLQGKTQLFPGNESDYFRNRLTHSLEVAQIASGIGDFLNEKYKKKQFHIDTDLLAFSGLAHDLGHPPFGHNGEKALDELMSNWGGFEGNAQTLRILASIEKKIVCDKTDNKLKDVFGLDLTYRSLASALKYDNCIFPRRSNDARLEKGYYKTEEELVKKIKENVAKGYTGKFKTIECAIMDIADDIAYSTYDLEDSYHACLLTPFGILSSLIDKDNTIGKDILEKVNQVLLDNNYTPINYEEMMHVVLQELQITDNGSSDDQQNTRPDITALLASYSLDRKMQQNEELRNSMTASRVGRLIKKVKLEINEEYPALSKVKLRKKALIAVETLKRINYELNIKSSKLSVIEYRGKDIVREIFTALDKSDGTLLPQRWKEKYQKIESESCDQEEIKTYKKRIICDFVSGMTDRYAAEFHNALFGSGSSIFNPL